jgi:1-acyl-sn-glycerol-3-phosphate acyltransferase
MAREFGVAIVPMSIAGAFELKRKGSWMLRPARIVVRLHDTIDPDAFADENALRRAVHAIVSGTVEAIRHDAARATNRETP